MTFEKTLPDPTVQDNPQDLDSWFNELTPDLDAWKRTHFYEISKPWRDLGYAVIPSNGPADKTPLEEKSWKQWCGPGRVPVPDDVWREWCLKYADHEGLLLGDSSTGGLPDLAFVDADHPSVFGWCVSTFAPTPMTVESGRKEGGRHHYYQVRPGVSVPQRAGQIGAPEHFQWAIGKDGRGRWKSPIDVKSSRSYVCVPGTRHKSGLIYTASAPITRETILALPVFDDVLYERLARTCKPGRVAQNTGASTAKPSGTSPVKGKTSTYFRESKPGSSIIPGPGLLAGKTLSEAARQLGPGAKVECGCPFHPSVSGRSATLRVLASGEWRLSCHVDTTTYTPAPAPIAKGTPNPRAAAELAAERAEDRRAGLVPVGFDFVEELRASLAEHPNVQAALEEEISRRAVEHISEDIDRMSSGVSNIDLGDHYHTPEDILTPTEVEDLTAAAVEALGGGAWINCPRGPLAAKARAGGYSEWRIACKGASCPVCGPWMALARRSAVAVLLRRMFDLGAGAGESPDLDASAERAAKRWAADAPAGSRAWLRARQPDGTSRVLFVWATPGDAPTGVLGRRLTPRHPEAWALDAVPSAPPGKGVRVLTGTAWLVSLINDLRLSVFARKSEPDGFKVRVTGAHSAELKDLMELAAGSLATTTRSSNGRYTRQEFNMRRGGKLTKEEADILLADQNIWRGGKKKKKDTAARLDALLDAGEAFTFDMA